jgi:hypothetical protein
MFHIHQFVSKGKAEHAQATDIQLPMILISQKSLLLKYLICIDAIAVGYRKKAPDHSGAIQLDSEKTHGLFLW